MKYVNKILLLCGFLFCQYTATGQYYSYKQLINKAEEAFEDKHYGQALNYYTQAIEQNDDAKPEIKYAVATSAHEIQSLKLAKEYYEQYLATEDVTYESKVLYKLAQLEHQAGSYDKALINYNLYLSEYEGDDPNIDSKIEFQKASAEWAMNNDVQESVEMTSRLNDTINSPSSENAPVLLGDELVYSSWRFPIEDDDLKRSKSELLKNGQIIDIPKQKDQLASNATFSNDNSKMIFTLCEYVDVYALSCRLYSADVGVDRSVTNVQALPQHINQLGSNTTQPALAEINGEKILYFASDRAGGKGKYDIYKVVIGENNVYGTPVNVMEVNSSGNDMTPSYHDQTETLYFSSDGRNGYGGFDIYKTDKTQPSPVNLGKNINTSYNELYYNLATDGIRGHFTSNRPGSSFSDDKFETCCYDIYEAKSKKCIINLNTLTFDNKSKKPLDKVNVKIVDTDSNVTLYDKSLDGNSNDIELPCNKNLKLIASKDGYAPVEFALTPLLADLNAGESLTENIYLNPDLVGLELTVLEEVAMGPLNGATVYLTDLSNNEQQKIENNPGNVFNFEIQPGKDYLLEINKDGFKEESINFNSGDGDVKITKQAILKYVDVVEKSIVSLEKAIPVSLYFDNDKPAIGASRNESAATYSTIYGDYYSQKDKFKNSYLNLFNGSDKLTANQEMDYLFENLVRAGFDKYDTFKKQLQIVLEAGQDVNVYLRGYTSPLAQGDYNIALGKRRVDSIRKEFDTWNNGVFIPYIQSGQLKVTERSFGETTAPAEISDDPNAPSKSIYSPEASRERRVEIDEIKIQR